MKKQPTSSVDGFVPRRSGKILGESQQPIGTKRPAVGVALQGEARQSMRPSRQVVRGDIDESLKMIDEEEEQAHWTNLAILSKLKIDTLGSKRVGSKYGKSNCRNT